MENARPAGRFPRTQRVRKRSEFQEAQAEGRRVATQHFALLVFARSDGARALPARLGITASRKVGPAVVRNRAKRLIREAFRATRDLWKPGIDLVVIVRRPTGGMKLDDVVAEWHAAAAAIERRTREAREDQARREREGRA